MKLTVVLFLCVTSFVRVRATHQDESLELEIYEHQTKSCGKHMRELHELAMDAMCSTPRPKLVTLMSKMGSQIFPPQIYLNRCDCDQKCPDNLQCVPKDVIMKKQMIGVMFEGRTKRRCLEQDLPEHTECTCGCTKTEKDCNQYQYFVPDKCLCMCRNETHRIAECKGNGSHFNKNTCMCECSTKMEPCSTGFTWSMNYCGCVKMEMTGDRGEEHPVME